MSEKRFKGSAEKTGQHFILIINDLLGEEYSLTDDFFKSKDVIFEIVDLLNVMNDTLLKQAKENHKLSNENGEQQATISRLEEENEQLRQTMQKVCKLLEEEVDLFSEKATEHDIIAYSEMQKFDNKDAYYICTATKKAMQMLKR